MINPVWLRSFCTLVEIGHFTRTAEQLNMTQSGVSQHVRKLEDHLGCPLLVRHGKSFTLTDAGDNLYLEGREVISALSGIEMRVGANPAYEGVVRIASPGSMGLKLYRHLLTVQQQHPKLVIDYRFAPNASVEQLIAENSVDIGFMTSPSTLADISSTAVAEEELRLITPAGINTPSWKQLMALGFIDHPDGAYHAGLLLSANYPEFQHVKQFDSAGFSNQVNLILEPVCMGLGFTVLPTYAIEAFGNTAAVTVHRLPHQIRETLYLAVDRNKVLPNRVNTVIAEAMACLK
ncbi:LysR family transcriptional regulator [Oceanicoccus sagamiensis]|uniref:LysR family transcriptional regulator n=1 Tax=Oceanicoccus sagamiensis TaxID=716816 RepID=A0A1X9N448_9GAMM|nr:LysR family transcriptional regulator [Oceanicoccus sagamiensis]ARN72930.1 LysR family transcriptional regulator [Oceanicoccus sagamiensis]